MITHENNCVDCGFPCRHDDCPYYDQLAFYCDKCGDQTTDLYDYNGMQLCKHCLLDTAIIRLSEK